MSNLFRCSLFSILACILLIPAPEPCAEGVQTGVIVGVVIDSQDLALPGVEVKLDGAQTRRRAQTDDEGRFRFPQLPIGSYQIDAELLGLMATQADVRVYIGKTTEAKLRLVEEGSEEPLESEITREQIQVLAVAPLIDRFETGVRTSVSRQFLEQLPVERFYQSVALLLPGVAGGEDGNPNTSGGLRSSNLFLVDGVDTTDPTTGLFGLNLSYDAVKDVDVTTAAANVDTGRASGATINVVTHSGSNRFRGSARWFATHRSWDADIEPVAGLEREVAAANGELGDGGAGELDGTFAATLSGPVATDSLWFFGVFENGAESFTRPTVDGPVWDEDADLSSSAFKLNWQVGAQSLVGQYNADDAGFSVYSPFNRAPGENRAARTPRGLNQEFLLPAPGDVFAIERRSQQGEFVKLEWNAVLGQNLALSARGALQDRRLVRSPLNRRADVAPHFAPTRFEVVDDPDFGLLLFEDDFALFNGITDLGDENRERQQANLGGNWFLVSGRSDHELSFGIDYQRTESDQLLRAAGQTGIDRVTGRPVDGQVFIDGDSRDACFFAADCRPFDTATGEFQPLFFLNFWQRPRQSTTQETLALHASDAWSFGRWLISLGLRLEMVSGEDAEGRDLVDDDSISPRLAVKYDAKGDGSVLLSAVYSRFVEAFPQRLLDDFVRMETFSGFTEYFWLDAFSAPECQFADPRDLTSPCWQSVFQEDFLTFQQAPPNLDLQRSAVDELVLGFERQLTAHTALRLNLIDRRWRDLWDDRFELNAEGTGIDAALANLPEAERTYRGIQLLVQRRYADNWQLLGSYTWSETEGNLFRSTGRDTFADFAEITDVNLVNREGLAPYDRTHQLKLFATYRWPIGRGQLAFGSSFRFESGTPYQGERFENFGLRFLNPRGSLQLDDFTQLDLSFAYDVPVTREMELGVKLEVFNLTDEQTVLGVETDVETGRFEQARDLADLQAPRNFRLTFAFHF